MVTIRTVGISGKGQPSFMPVGMLEVTLLALGDAALDNISPGPSQGKPFCSPGAGYRHLRSLWHIVEASRSEQAGLWDQRQCCANMIFVLSRAPNEE